MSNPGGPIILTLSSWVQQRLSAVIQATTRAAFNEAFDNFIAVNCDITVNGVPLSRDQYKKQLRNEELLETSAEVKFDGTVEVPEDPKALITTGLVGLFYEATINRTQLIQQTKVTSSLNVFIARDESFQPTNSDNRHVVTLNQVLIDQPTPLLTSSA